MSDTGNPERMVYVIRTALDDPGKLFTLQHGEGRETLAVCTQLEYATDFLRSFRGLTGQGVAEPILVGQLRSFLGDAMSYGIHFVATDPSLPLHTNAKRQTLSVPEYLKRLEDN